MSVAAVDWALRRAPVGADASERLVLVYLADRADDEGRDAFPSIATLSSSPTCPEALSSVF